jgi:hypothetical protein
MFKIISILIIILVLGINAQALNANVTINATIDSNPNMLYFVGNTSHNQTITLPDAATSGWKGKILYFVLNADTGTHYFRLYAVGADHINENDYYYTTTYPASVVIVSDGADYHVIGTPLGTWTAAIA